MKEQYSFKCYWTVFITFLKRRPADAGTSSTEEIKCHIVFTLKRKTSQEETLEKNRGQCDSDVATWESCVTGWKTFRRSPANPSHSDVRKTRKIRPTARNYVDEITSLSLGLQSGFAQPWGSTRRDTSAGEKRERPRRSQKRTSRLHRRTKSDVMRGSDYAWVLSFGLVLGHVWCRQGWCLLTDVKNVRVWLVGDGESAQTCH